jgi:capsid protein
MNQKLKAAREANEIARLKLDTLARARRAAFLGKYDATESSTARRAASPERQSEAEIYSQSKRHLGTNIGRDLERNYAPARGLLHQFRMNVVGEQGKLQVNLDGGEQATEWFNGVWCKDCDDRDDLHFSQVLQNVVASVMREGDVLAVVDDDLIRDSGKLLHWESDQIAPVSDTLLERSRFKGAVQDQGIMRDTWGRILGYATTGKHGLQIIDNESDATYWLRANARLVKNPWRMNQGRGIPSLLTAATNFIDLYEILGAELSSAKRAAVIAGFTKRTNATTDWDNSVAAPAYLPENSGKDATTTAAEGANSTTPSARNYERFENLSGGYFEYLDAGDEITFPDITRPNIHLAEFMEAILGHAGASVGLARAYTILRADSSYTAFRGDMILSWVTFYAMQKWLERSYADWVARKVLGWAQRKNIIKPLPAGWETQCSWVWPVMPHVDEAREAIAEAQSLKNGTADFSDYLGPNWENKFASLARQLAVARDMELPLSVFEQKSGGAAPSESGKA